MTDVELSGETLDLVIPVGTNVVTKSSTGELISVNIGDLNRGNTVKIWLLEGGEGDLGLAEGRDRPGCIHRGGIVEFRSAAGRDRQHLV